MRLCGSPKWFFLFTFLLTSCASTHYGFFPASAPDEKISVNERGATFPLSLGKGEGTLHAMSYGVIQLQSKDKKNQDVQVPALHLCMIVTNKSGTSTWELNTRDQIVMLSGKNSVGPSYVDSDRNEHPTIKIPPGQTRHLDLFYPLPKGQAKPKELSGFDLKWKIISGKDSVARTTPFIRKKTQTSKEFVEVNSPLVHQNQIYDEEEMSPHNWWYDPIFPYPF